MPFSAPIVIVIWTLASELSAPGTQAMAGAAREALGPDAQIVVKASVPSDERDSPTEEQASSVVHLTWDPAEHRRARILCFLPKSGRWLERQITFSEADPEIERGRTLGFFLASMFVEAGIVTEPNLHSQKDSPALPTQPQASSIQVAVPGAQKEGSSSAKASAKPAPRADSPLSSALPAARNALVLAASTAFPGTSTAFGVWLGAERALSGSSLWIGARGEVRLGSVSAAQALSVFSSLGLSTRWVYWLPTDNVRLSIRVEGAAALLSLVHLSSDDPAPDWESRIVPVFGLLHPVTFRLAATSALLLEAGVEFIPGTTEVYVRQSRAAVWPMWSGLGRVGFQATF